MLGGTPVLSSKQVKRGGIGFHSDAFVSRWKLSDFFNASESACLLPKTSEVQLRFA
jgi:hypothetical protein